MRVRKQFTHLNVRFRLACIDLRYLILILDADIIIRFYYVPLVLNFNFNSILRVKCSNVD